MASLEESVRFEVPHHIDHAGLVDDRAGVRLVADDQSLALAMKKLPPRPGVLEHRVTKMPENRFELGPTQIGRRRARGQPRQGFLVLGHGSPPTELNSN
jgi:hypothetical protein